MPVPYNTSAIDSSNLYTMFKGVNDGISGAFMPVMLGVIWIVAFIGGISEGREASRGFLFASFISSILAIILALIGMLNPNYMYFSFLLVGIGLIWHKLSTSPGF